MQKCECHLGQEPAEVSQSTQLSWRLHLSWRHKSNSWISKQGFLDDVVAYPWRKLPSSLPRWTLLELVKVPNKTVRGLTCRWLWLVSSEYSQRLKYWCCSLRSYLNTAWLPMVFKLLKTCSACAGLTVSQGWVLWEKSLPWLLWRLGWAGHQTGTSSDLSIDLGRVPPAFCQGGSSKNLCFS